MIKTYQWAFDIASGDTIKEKISDLLNNALYSIKDYEWAKIIAPSTVAGALMTAGNKKFVIEDHPSLNGKWVMGHFNFVWDKKEMKVPVIQLIDLPDDCFIVSHKDGMIIWDLVNWPFNDAPYPKIPLGVSSRGVG